MSTMLVDCHTAARSRSMAIQLAAKAEVGAEAAMPHVYTGASPSIFGSGGADRDQLAHYSGWPYASIRPIAQTIAGLPIHVGRLRSTPTKRSAGTASRPMTKAEHRRAPGLVKAVSDNVEVYESHPLLDALADPNPMQVGWHLFCFTVTSLELSGWAYWWITKVDGRQVIWPLPPSWVTARHTADKAFASWLITPGGAGAPIERPPEEVAPFYYVDPRNPLSAYGPTQAQSRAILSDEAIQKAQHKGFSQGIFPGLGIYIGDISGEGEEGELPLLEKEQRQEIYDGIMQWYGSVDNANHPLIFDRLVRDAKPITRTMREMDWLDSGRTTKARITQGYGTNPAVIGEIEGLNRASAAEARKHFADFCVNPKVELLSQMMSKFVAPHFARPGERLVVWMDSYEPDDRLTTISELSMAAKYAAVSRQEIRDIIPSLAGLPDLDSGGDLIFTPANVMPQPVRTGGDKSAQSKTKGLAYTQSVWLKSHGERERAMLRVLQRLFDEQRDDVKDRLRSATGRDASSLVDAVFPTETWTERWATALRPVMVETAVLGAVQMAAFTDRSATPWLKQPQLPQYVIDAILAEIQTILSRPYWGEIQQTTRQAMVDSLSEGLLAGENSYQLGTRIDDIFGGDTATFRLMNIARTESTAAWNAGGHAQLLELESSGVATHKRWEAVLDSYTRDTHAGLHASPPIPISQDFDVGGYPAPYPGHYSLPAQERCFCRCTSLPVMDTGPLPLPGGA